MPRTVLILIFALAAGSGARASTRNVQFPGGQASVDSEGDVDHVVVRDVRGKVMADSRCDSGRFSEYFDLFTRFKDAITAGDRDAALGLVDYPLRVNVSAKKSIVFKTASSLSKNYAKIFTAAVRERIRQAEPAAVFCRNGQAMLGDGLIWANRAGVAIVNP